MTTTISFLLFTFIFCGHFLNQQKWGHLAQQATSTISSSAWSTASRTCSTSTSSTTTSTSPTTSNNHNRTTSCPCHQQWCQHQLDLGRHQSFRNINRLSSTRTASSANSTISPSASRSATTTCIRQHRHHCSTTTTTSAASSTWPTAYRSISTSRHQC